MKSNYSRPVLFAALLAVMTPSKSGAVGPGDTQPATTANAIMAADQAFPVILPMGSIPAEYRTGYNFGQNASPGC